MSGITIPQGKALTFARPQDGDIEWHLRNTARGLVIEACDLSVPEPSWQPVLSLTPRGVVIRGDLSVTGNIGRTQHCHEFVGRWRVTAGSIPRNAIPPEEDPKPEYDVIIKDKGHDRFELTYAKRDQDPPENGFKQILTYNRWTGTLDTAEGQQEPYRSVSFWAGDSACGDGKPRIFAMRRKVQGAVPEKNFLPWELGAGVPGDDDGVVLADDDKDGSWGADPG